MSHFIDNTYQKTPISSMFYICTTNVSKTSSIWDINQCVERSENGSNSTALSRTMLFISITYYHHDSNG